MKIQLKNVILTAALGFGLTVGFTQLLNKKQEEEQVNLAAQYKAKSREKLKPHKYDGSKITYFNYLTYEQKKSIEVLMYNGIDYKFCFNTDGVPKGIDLKIYDKPSPSNKEEENKRVLLFEANDVMQKDLTVTSSDMLKNLQAKKDGVTSIKKVYIEYIVPIGDKTPAPSPSQESGKKGEEAPVNPMERGMVVVSFGYKNI